MKLSKYIEDNHNGNASEYARVNGYHLTQVNRCIEQGGIIDEDNKPYFKKYLNKSKSIQT